MTEIPAQATALTRVSSAAPAARLTECSVCAAPAPTDPPPLTWSTRIQGRDRLWSCLECTRINLHRIETRMSPVLW